MSEKWYYVSAGERQGPVPKEDIIGLISTRKLQQQDYVWRKGFDNWKRIQDVEELVTEVGEDDEFPQEIPQAGEFALDLSELNPREKKLFIKIGADRGASEVEYGPFSLEILKKLYEEKRINGKTFLFTAGMSNWMPLGDIKGFDVIFESAPPIIRDEDRRAFKRRPFVARMFFENQSQIYEGICRDVSVGGMQVLVDHFPAKVGEKITINAHPENSDYHFTASAHIVRVLDGGIGFSLRFMSLSEEAIKAINSYVSQE